MKNWFNTFISNYILKKKKHDKTLITNDYVLANKCRTAQDVASVIKGLKIKGGRHETLS